MMRLYRIDGKCFNSHIGIKKQNFETTLQNAIE